MAGTILDAIMRDMPLAARNEGKTARNAAAKKKGRVVNSKKNPTIPDELKKWIMKQGLDQAMEMRK